MQTPTVKTAPTRSPRRRAQAQKALIKVPVDATLKRGADELFACLGFDTPTAIRIFLTRAVQFGGIPFKIIDPLMTKENLETLEESERLIHDPNAKTYTDVGAMLKEILADEG